MGGFDLINLELTYLPFNGGLRENALEIALRSPVTGFIQDDAI